MSDYIGQTLGQYRLEALLGAGGMGQVYRGVHKLLDRPAAIKVMLASYASNAQFRARFLQEARVVAALHHPNVVEIYEFGEQDGVLFLVMELMSDGSLLSLLRGRSGQPLPLAQALDLGSQIAEGLASAHTKQIIHRDIKPANLLLQLQPGSVPGRELYRVKINDFGLARMMEGGVETVTGAPMGTLAYMSPEQCMGDRQIDGRSDLYALGVVLYEMATGYQPFQINGVTDALYKHVNVPPPSPREIRPDLPPMLEEIILRCLAKKPEDRFTNGNALSTALQSVLGNTGEKTTATVSQQYGSTRTTLDAPAANVAPPTISTMPGYSDKPRVRVLNQNGETLQVAEVRPQGLIVGRQQGNDVVLLSQSVSRQHLLISWDGKQVTVKDLGSSNGTILDGTRLLPEVNQVWEERQSIRLGAFWLRLEGASAPMTQMGETSRPRFSASQAGAPTVASSRASAAGASSPSFVSGRIGLTVAPKTLTITPGQPASIQITLTNVGQTVDWFTPTVEGVPPEWVQGAGQEVQLNPGMQESVNFVINVARHPGNRARDYPVIIRARSREQPQDFSTTHGTWIVQPFREDALRLEPRRATGRGKADYTVALNNGSNSGTRYILSGDDDEQKLTYQFHVNPLDLDAGQQARVPLTVRTNRHLLKREERVPFQLHAGPIDNPPTQTIAGEFVNKPLLPAWLLPTIAALLVAGLGLSALLGIFPPRASGKLATGSPTTVVQIPSPSPQLTPSPALSPSPQITPSPSPQLSPTSQPTPPTANSATPLVSGLSGPIGAQYVASQDSLYFVEYSGKVSVLRNISSGSPAYNVLGTGYSALEDLYVMSDGTTMYLTERSEAGGVLLKVNLSVGANRSQAQVVASGLNAPQQIAVDEAHNVAYIAEFNDGGPLGSVVSVDLGSGTVTPILNNLQHPIGVLFSPDGNSLYVTEQLSTGGSHLSRYNLAPPNTGKVLATSVAPLFLLSWADASQNALLVTERANTNAVWYMDLTRSSPSLHKVATVGSGPSSVVVASTTSLFPMLVCVAGSNQIVELNG